MQYVINQIYNLLSVLNNIISNQLFFSAALLFISIVVKIVLIYKIGKQHEKIKNYNLLLLFGIPLLTYAFSELSLFMFLFSVDSPTTKMIIRIAWHMQPLQFFTQSLFLIVITRQQHKITKMERSILQLLSIFIFLPLLLLINMPTNLHWLLKLFLEIFCRVNLLKKYILKISGIMFLLITIVYRLKKLHSIRIKNILQLQIIQFLLLLFAYLIPETVLVSAAILPSLAFLNNEITLNLLSSTFFTSFLIFTSQKLYNLRFLNLTQHVQTKPIAKLTDEEFLEIKESLCEANTPEELLYIHNITRVRRR